MIKYPDGREYSPNKNKTKLSKIEISISSSNPGMGFEEDINIHCIGAVCEMYDGDPSHHPHGAINSSLSAGEILRIFSF